MAAGEDWDRRQLAEDRWRKALEEHERDPLAHSPARHEQVNDWVGRFQIPIQRQLMALEDRMSAIELSRAEERGEWKATRRMVSIVGGIVGLLVTSFGAAILFKLGAI